MLLTKTGDRSVPIPAVVILLGFFFVPTVARAQTPPAGLYTYTCTGAAMTVGEHNVPMLSANCLNFFYGQYQATTLYAPFSCNIRRLNGTKPWSDIVNQNGNLRCPVTAHIDPSGNGNIDVIGVTTWTDASYLRTYYTIDQPTINQPSEPYPMVSYKGGDSVTLWAGGCAQGGGGGQTWYSYVEPIASSGKYWGMASLPGTLPGVGTNGADSQFQYIGTLNGGTDEFYVPGGGYTSGYSGFPGHPGSINGLKQLIPSDTTENNYYLTLGYIDDGWPNNPGSGYPDNGYYSPDGGQDGQCPASPYTGPVWVMVEVDHPVHPLSSLRVTDISPDSPYGSLPAPTDFGDTGGRIYSLAMAPNNKTLYAAAFFSGVWKSTDTGRSWHQSSLGMKNALNIRSNTSLALDSANPKRLLYATSHLDGRPGSPYAGLWTSTDFAATWQHADLSSKPGAPSGLCPGFPGDISSVAFDSGQAFVAAPCGIFTNADPDLADDKWTALSDLPFNPQDSIIAPNSSGNVLFICSGTSVYRSSTLGKQSGALPVWEPAVNLGSHNDCHGLSVVPSKGFVEVAVVHKFPEGKAQLEVTIVNFSTLTSQSLGFSQQALATQNSGVPAVFTAARPDGNGSSTPGVGYDVYAADECGFWVFSVQTGSAQPSSPKWVPVMPRSAADDCNSGIHADSWSMAISTNYNPAGGVCTAFAATDGGVFMNPSAKLPSAVACSLTGGWVTAMSGLHTLKSGTMAGVSEPQSICLSESSPCPALYLPNGDNDVWASTQGEKRWGQLEPKDMLGDAGQVQVDPAVPGQVVAARNGHVTLLVSPDGLPVRPGNPGGQTMKIVPPHVNYGKLKGYLNLTQVLSVTSDPPLAPLYFAVETPPNKQNPDVVVQYQYMSDASSINWIPVEAHRINSFGNKQIAEITSSGGLKSTVLFVLTANGQVYKGPLVNSKVKKWIPISTTQQVLNAEALFVDPYDPKVAYVSDLGNPSAHPPVAPAIRFTKDGGTHWAVEPTLTAIASDRGEFQSFSQYMTNVTGTSDARYPSLSGMFFDRANSQIRAASTYPGGVAFSRDGGKHWIALHVTNDIPNSNSLQNPIELPTSVFYDDQLSPQTGQPSLYVTRLGRGIIRVDGPFPTLQSLQFIFCPVCVDSHASSTAKVSVVIPALNREVPLQQSGGGLYTSSIVYDEATLSNLTFHFKIDGETTANFSRVLTEAEKKSGVAVFTNQAQ